MVITQTSNGNYTRVTPKPQTQSAASSAEKNNGKIDTKEKKFFADMFPDYKEEIMNYHFYERSGKMNGIKIGSNYDRRG